MSRNRDINERVKECVTLNKKLGDLGIMPYFSGTKIFLNACNEFIKNEKEYEDVIVFEEYPNLKLIVSLKLSKNVDCSVRVRNRK